MNLPHSEAARCQLTYSLLSKKNHQSFYNVSYSLAHKLVSQSVMTQQARLHA